MKEQQEDKPKHGACFDCKTPSTEHQMLFSIPVPGELMSKAVCDSCLRNRPENAAMVK